MTDHPAREKRWRRWLIIPPVVVGMAVLVTLVVLRDPPARREATEVARTLRVIQLSPLDVLPRVVGHGTSRPARSVRVVAEVPGRVISVHPDLRAGAIIRARS